MASLKRPAQLYIIATLIGGLFLMAWQLPRLDAQKGPLIVATCIVAALLQIFKVEGSTTRSSYNLGWVVYGFALVDLGLPAALLVILVAHLIEWLNHRYLWYIQIFNITSFAIAMSVAGFTFNMLSAPWHSGVTQTNVVAIVAAATSFTAVNHFMIGWVIKLARGQSLAQSGVFGSLTLMLDFGLFCLGTAAALVWIVDPFSVVIVAFLAYLLHNVLKIPALQRKTEREPKTGLYNAEYLNNILKEEWARAQRFDRPLTVIMADLDLLRNINNTYGHMAGDVVIKGVADILQAATREYDVVARFGGEEFAILMPETEPEQAYIAVERIRMTIANAEFQVATSPTPIKVTMSFGIAGRHDSQHTVDELLEQADEAVYEAKSSGRNRTHVSKQGILAPDAGQAVMFPARG